MRTPKDLIVVGAGLAGLTIAYEARRAGLSVQVVDAGAVAGGVIQSQGCDGHLLDYGPNSATATPEILRLIDGLDLKSSMLIASAGTPRFVQFGGRLHAVPMSPRGFILSQLLDLRGKFRLLTEPTRRPMKKNVDESLASFARRRLGVQATERLVASFVSGVWAGDAETLSAAAAFPALVRWEDEEGSLLRGLLLERKKKSAALAEKSDASAHKTARGLFSFRDGMAALPRALAAALGDAVQLNARVERITRPIAAGDVWRVMADEETWPGAHVAITAPAYESADFIRSFAPRAADELAAIPYAPVVLLHLSVPASDFARPLNGFGHLVAPSDGGRVIGCLWNSSVFADRAPKGSVLLTAFIGGARQPDVLNLTDSDLTRAATAELMPVLGIRRSPRVLSLKRLARAIPQYTIGHLSRVATVRAAEEMNPGLRFAGNYLDGISVGDVVKNATATAEKIAQTLGRASTQQR